MTIFNRYRFQGSLLGWFLGISVSFFAGLWLVQKYGPKKPTDESAIAIFLLGLLILALLLVLTLLL
ncbi:hypothetical protein [Thermococcus sp.]|uniref:hypothetical protein n=1 Tax=Thermococcus sp. TaxID=35749 RepID=UPI0026286DC7|nr:hypothetical protein [Thermococcus sp.]